MTRRSPLPRALAALAGSLLFLVLMAPAALARAGSGSSGFSGGGSSGGSSGGGSFGGGSSYGGSSTAGNIAVGVMIGLVVLIFIGYWIYRQAVNAWVRGKLRVRRERRVKRVELAAAEAAEDDAAFAVDAIRQGADQLFRQVQAAWSENDIATLDKLVADELMVEWRRRLKDFEKKGWHNICEVLGQVGVEYVGLVNRAADEEDRAVVRIHARLRDYVVGPTGLKRERSDASSELTTVAEYWTLGKREDGGWRLLSIEQDIEGAHVLDSEIVATPWSDERLRDEALVEGAVADKIVDGYKISDIADLDFDGDARAAALDLSLADARFAPDILETAARRAVGGWAEAVDGEDDELLAVATPEALHDLLYPGVGDKSRVVVRGPRIERLEISALDAAADPPTMTIEIAVRGRRYIQDRDTAEIVTGNPNRETGFIERWLLALTDDEKNPWRIVDAKAPRRRPAGGAVGGGS
jgi:predicted lipid-binding transport protein (Tim44 family)